MADGPSTAPELVPGFTLLGQLGTGGFSVVYRAGQEGLSREVALKVLNIDLTEAGGRQLFERECQNAGRLSNHPNVVIVHTYGFTRDGRPYLVMELCERGSLADQIVREGPLSEEEVLDLGVKMADVLSLAHEYRIVHRDIKPQNILLDTWGEPKLGDFGISKVTDPGAQASGVVLTPVYAPPELFEGLAANPTSDIYSLGATLYTALAGAPPFATNLSLPALISQILEKLPDDLAGVDPSVTELLRKAMAKRPEDRFETAEQMAVAMQALQQRLGLSVTTRRVAAGRRSSTTLDPTAQPGQSTTGGAVTPRRSIAVTPPGSTGSTGPTGAASPTSALDGPGSPGAAVADRSSSAARVPTNALSTPAPASGGVGAAAPPFPVAVPAPARSRKGLILAGVGVAAAAVIAGVVVLSGGKGDTPGPRFTIPTTSATVTEPTAPTVPATVPDSAVSTASSATAPVTPPTLDPGPRIRVNRVSPPGPPAPGDVRVAVVAPGEIRVTWKDPSFGLAPFVVAISGDDKSSRQELVDAGNESVVVDGLLPDLGYCITVGTLFGYKGKAEIEPPRYHDPLVCVTSVRPATPQA